MKPFALTGVVALAVLSGPALAQQGAAALTDAQRAGQGLYVQHCGVCHAKIQINVPAPNGPVLSKAIFENGGDARVKAQIADGSPNMPGYKLMFEPAQIDGIVEYLKTVNPPPPPATPVRR